MLFLGKKINYQFLDSLLQLINGRGDRDRTCDLMVPNHARYQLRYTSKLNKIVQRSYIITHFKNICKNFYKKNQKYPKKCYNSQSLKLLFVNCKQKIIINHNFNNSDKKF